MYGRADGMPSFQLTVAVCAGCANFTIYKLVITRSIHVYVVAALQMNPVDNPQLQNSSLFLS
jgi:uncharacterized membrane protein YhfC